MKAPLKLIAFDEEDLGILSFHVHNAQVQVKNMLRQAVEKRFLLALRRFDWEAAMADKKQAEKTNMDNTAHGEAEESKQKSRQAKRAAVKAPREIPAILHFDRVLNVRFHGIDRQKDRHILSLKGLCFREKRPPGGVIEFLFAENAGLQLEVECIEARLEDLPAGL